MVKRDPPSDDLVTHELCHIWQLQHHPVRMPLSFLKTPLQEERLRARGALGRRPDAREAVSVAPAPAALAGELGRIVGTEHATATVPAEYLVDASVTRGVRGHADVLVRPGSPQEVADVVAWCYDHDVAVVPRGGGTGYAGGAVPEGGVVLALERLRPVRAIDPERGGWSSRPASRPRSVGRPRASTASTSRPTRAPPSSRTSAATSRPTPAGRTASSTA